jgi:four helix bundle protein
MRNFRNWDVWKEGILLVKDIYELTKRFPEKEKFGIISQLQKAAVSIPANIAEGAGRHSEKELNQFLYISLGSSFELETLIIIAHELAFINDENKNTVLDKLTIIQKRLNTFISKLKNR